MSRRPDPAPPNRTARLCIRLSRDERGRIDRAAQEAGHTVFAWSRKALLGTRPRRRLRGREREAVYLLARAANNLKQLLRVAEAAGEAQTAGDVRETLEHVQERIRGIAE